MSSNIRGLFCVICKNYVAKDEMGRKMNEKEVICIDCLGGKK